MRTPNVLVAWETHRRACDKCQYAIIPCRYTLCYEGRDLWRPVLRYLLLSHSKRLQDGQIRALMKRYAEMLEASK